MASKKKIGGSAKAARRRSRKRAGKIEARRKKEFTYRGRTLEELKKLSLDEMIPLLPARARRSFRRGLNEEQRKFVDRVKADKESVVKTHRRDIVIMPDFVGKKIAVYDGHVFQEFTVMPEMIGHFTGEFSMTRKGVKHSGPGVGATRSSKFMPLK